VTWQHKKTGAVHRTYRCGDVRSNFCCGKAVNIAYSLGVSAALVVQHAMRLRRLILSSVTSVVLYYFSTLSHKGTTFGKKKWLNIKMCVLIFCATFV